jgi:hypothetical protein
MDLEALKRGRRAYVVAMVVTAASAITQSRIFMTAGLVANAIVWCLVVWESQRDISRARRERERPRDN